MTSGTSASGPGPGQEPSVDELRQRLRALGYLDAGVDRFVLGPAREARPPAAIAALASLRVGVLAGALLGPAAALGIGTRLPTLVTGPRDAVVIAVYLALLFGAAVMVMAFLASLLVAKLPIAGLARHARIVSRAAGTLVGAGCLVYLTLWWRITNLDPGAPSLAWSLFVLAIAVSISLLLGHVTAITAFAVIAAGHDVPAARDPRAQSTWRLTAAAAVLAFAGAASLLLLAAPQRSADTPAPSLAVVSPGLRVKVVAIDGFDPEVAGALAAEGRAPAFRELLSKAVVRVAPEDIRDPARAWTTVATGQPVDVHGVYGLETRRVAGVTGAVTSEAGGIAEAIRGATDLLRLTSPSVASGTERRSKTFWEVAADAGLRPAVVNWWATWPAVGDAPHAPVVVSDRATLRLERGGDLDGEISPPPLYESLRAAWPAIRAEAAASIDSLLPSVQDDATHAALRRAAEVDALQLAIATRLDPASLDLLAIYLPGLDIAQHALLSAGPSSASSLSSRLDALRSYYVYLDGLLTPVLAPADGELVIVVTEPGRVESITHGLMVLRGRIAAASGAAEARAVDVAPTILHALGVPIGRDLAGAPVQSVFTSEFASRFPVRQVDSYGQRNATAGRRQGQPLDQEMIERLRSLGYVR
jgi:hypothetical protein